MKVSDFHLNNKHRIVQMSVPLRLFYQIHVDVIMLILDSMYQYYIL